MWNFCLHYTCITETSKQHYRIEKKTLPGKGKGSAGFCDHPLAGNAYFSFNLNNIMFTLLYMHECFKGP